MKINSDLTCEHVFSCHYNHEKNKSTFIDASAHKNSLYILSSIGDSSYVVKLTDNIIDLSFGIHGKLFINSSMTQILLDTYNKKLILTGLTNHKFTINKYNLDGSPDTSFGMTDYNMSGAIGSLIIDSTYNKILSMIVNGKIICACHYNKHIFIYRYHLNGTIDDNFGTDGITNISYGISNISSLYANTSGDIYISGISDGDTFILCLKPNGIINENFFNGIKIFPSDDSSSGSSCISDSGSITLSSSGLIKLNPVTTKSWFGYFTY
jgi:hypothetical protein